MWRLYWRITDGYWKDDLCSPDDILHFWLHIPQVIKIFKNNKNEKNSWLYYISHCVWRWSHCSLLFIIHYCHFRFFLNGFVIWAKINKMEVLFTERGRI